jgi:hypothetical protein
MERIRDTDGQGFGHHRRTVLGSRAERKIDTGGHRRRGTQTDMDKDTNRKGQGHKG